MASAVYVLCAIASAACAVLLCRGYLRTRTRLLLWSTICFAFLAVNNVLLVAGRVIWAGTDLSLARGITSLVAVGTLVTGFVLESK